MIGLIFSGILDRAVSLLKQLKLTTIQWVLLALSSIIGILIMLLRQKGNQLHKVQVQLLQQKHLASDQEFDHTMARLHAKTESSRKAFEDAMNDYQNSLAKK